ncbi:MAG TPA: DOMON-like domain-containing protein [Bdellovibrionota bacterium]|jgi:hypothetical protein|nr:DOMON-like domain-containing protein [Bdellovibrionota bacterium]
MGIHAQLTPHPSTPGPDGLTVGVQLRRTEGGRLLLAEYRLAGETDTVLWPKAKPGAGRRDRLWERTCLELFWAQPGSEGYWEANLSPEGDWALYRFSKYREGMAPEERCDLRVARGGSTHAGFAVDLGALGLGSAAVELNATAVIQEASGQVRYWAAKHRVDQPDFHWREAFGLHLGVGK